LLPAGAKVAGWDFHPLENAALARRTPQGDIGSRISNVSNQKNFVFYSANKTLFT
jgi:hypothetical protein